MAKKLVMSFKFKEKHGISPETHQLFGEKLPKICNNRVVVKFNKSFFVARNSYALIKKSLTNFHR